MVWRPAVRAVVVGLLCTLPGLTAVYAQTAQLSGFVTDAASGQPLELVNVAVEGADGRLRGTVTDAAGSYLIPRLEGGRYVLRASFVGYDSFADTLDIAPDESRNVNIALEPADESLDEVVVEAQQQAEANRPAAGVQRIRPADIALVPSPDVSGDLATYLTTVGGVVATADRGGQLFIRGGEPSQNLVMIDGIVIYQPFHLLGFYSAFPTSVIRQVDLYAGGFGPAYGGRLSSVVDVQARQGNMRRIGGSLSASPFVSAVQVEGPVVPGRVSVLGSLRGSTLEAGAERLVDQELPFRFGDAFGRADAVVSARSRLSVTGLRTWDEGRVAGDAGPLPPDDLRWTSSALGARYLLLPGRLPALLDVRVSQSRLRAEAGPASAPLRRSTLLNTQVRIEGNFYGERVDAKAGIDIQAQQVNSTLAGVYQNVEFSRSGPDHTALYLAPTFRLPAGLQLQPGLRLQFYAIRIDPFLEPRLRVAWSGGPHRLSGALGLYHQEVFGLTDRRDAASVFVAWTTVPREGPRVENILAGRIQRSLHALGGYGVRLAPGADVSVEAFYRAFTNIYVAEWTGYPRFTTRLQPATGRSVGADVRVELRRGPFTGFLTYGLSSTRYEAEQAEIELWYGTETLRFRPPHDRRHQINAVAAADVAGFTLSARWAFGSGLPFSRVYGFDGFVLVEDIVDVSKLEGSRRAIYERPYTGLLPTYHRLDVSLGRTFALGPADLAVQASVINAYDRRNIFYLDVFTQRRVDQLPFIPSLGLEVRF